MSSASRWAPLALSLLFALLVACGPGDGRTPRVESLRFDGQSPDSELVLLFTVHLTDPDGDLGSGRLETFINRAPSALGALELRPLFLFNEVPLDATEAEIQLSLELALNAAPETATRFELGVRAIDASGNASAIEVVELEVTPR